MIGEAAKGSHSYLSSCLPGTEIVVVFLLGSISQIRIFHSLTGPALQSPHHALFTVHFVNLFGGRMW